MLCHLFTTGLTLQALCIQAVSCAALLGSSVEKHIALTGEHLTLSVVITRSE